MNNAKEIIDTKITDKWGVIWDEMETVRDFLQNFYDANPNISDIKIDISETTVSIFAPAVFDSNELIYLGSDKSSDDSSIGQYGEGFKASVLNALRNWNCQVEIIINDNKLRFYFEIKKIGKDDKRVIFCEKSTTNFINGTQLIISNCTSKLLEEFKFGLNYFYSNHNPLFGDKLANTYSGDIEIYKSTDYQNGYIFYKKLLRSKIELPIVIVCNKVYQNVENKIKHDRDRKAFNDEVQASLIKLVFKNFSNRELGEMLNHLINWWVKGHKILAIIADTRNYKERCNRIKSTDFPVNYYAKESLPKNNPELSLEIKQIIQELGERNAQCCPRYMSNFGMDTPDFLAERRIKKRKDELNKEFSRDLTIEEKKGIILLSYFIKELSPDLYKTFETAKYTVGENEEVIGELKNKRAYKQQHVYLNKIFFTLNFSEALAILLHEWAHIYGGDGSRSFSDALTHFIALILNNTNVLNDLKRYEVDWDNVVKNIKNERKIVLDEDKVYKQLDSLTNSQLKKILKSIPQDDLYNLFNQNKIVG